MRIPVLIVLLGSAAFAAGCAHDREQASSTSERDFAASEPADVQPQKITRYADEDRDGFVTRKEAKADKALAASFDRYDVDDNDKLDRGEFARLEAARNDRAASSSASHDATVHGDRWVVEKPDGYFGPERESLNRTGAQRE